MNFASATLDKINNLEVLKDVGNLKDRAAERLRNKMGTASDFKEMMKAQKAV